MARTRLGLGRHDFEFQCRPSCPGSCIGRSCNTAPRCIRIGLNVGYETFKNRAIIKDLVGSSTTDDNAVQRQESSIIQLVRSEIKIVVFEYAGIGLPRITYPDRETIFANLADICSLINLSGRFQIARFDNLAISCLHFDQRKARIGVNDRVIFRSRPG